MRAPPSQTSSTSARRGCSRNRNGHLLVAKRREEPRLIEFGPPDHTPGGFRLGHALHVDESVSLPAGETVTFAVLASWPLDADTALESIHDLAIDADGRVHAVSSKSRCLARLDADRDPSAGTAPLTAWPLALDVEQHPGACSS